MYPQAIKSTFAITIGDLLWMCCNHRGFFLSQGFFLQYLKASIFPTLNSAASPEVADKTIGFLQLSNMNVPFHLKEILALILDPQVFLYRYYDLL